MSNNQPDKTSLESHGKSKESTMLLQGILVWMMLLIAVLTLWTTCTALGYLIQNNDLSLWYRVIRSSVVATILIIAGLLYLRKLFRADSMSRSQSKLK